MNKQEALDKIEELKAFVEECDNDVTKYISVTDENVISCKGYTFYDGIVEEGDIKEFMDEDGCYGGDEWILAIGRKSNVPEGFKLAVFEDEDTVELSLVRK